MGQDEAASVLAVHRSGSHSFSKFAQEAVGEVQPGDAVRVELPAGAARPLEPV